jgi:hypothetical protein
MTGEIAKLLLVGWNPSNRLSVVNTGLLSGGGRYVVSVDMLDVLARQCVDGNGVWDVGFRAIAKAVFGVSDCTRLLEVEG